MKSGLVFFLFGMLLIAPHARGGSSADMPGPADSTSAGEHKKSRFSQLIHNSISVSKRDYEAEKEAAKRDLDYYKQFEGRTIGTISVNRNNVFDENTRRWGERKINAIHRITRESQVRKDLFIEPGDKLDPKLVMNNRQLLRSRDYISDAGISVVPSATDSSVVDLVITTWDKWTVSLDGEFKGNGNSYIELYDDNILGWGHRLSVSTYFNYKDWHYGGNVFEYENPNIMGTFFSGRLIAGHGFEHLDYGGEFKKEFIKPRDYAGGASFFYRQEPVKIYPVDSTIEDRYRIWNAWAGKSIYLKNLKSSLFFTGGYKRLDYIERPEVSEALNPYFHNEEIALVSVGLYREQFRTSSLIYGYGVNEDIPYGFRFTLTGGHSWGEFGKRWYLGGDFSAGYFTRIGYLRWSVALGSYMNRCDSRFYRTAVVSNINYFSNLTGKGRYKVRQFINLNYTRGWNRLDGFRESIGFVDEARLRGLKEDIYGSNRLTVTSESVVFTPWKIHEFRFAIYGFADFGLIGDDLNIFGNRFYSTIGAGVRIKNENMVFGTINIRLGIAVGHNGFMNADYFHISSEQRRNPLRFIPQQAATIDYR